MNVFNTSTCLPANVSIVFSKGKPHSFKIVWATCSPVMSVAKMPLPSLSFCIKNVSVCVGLATFVRFVEIRLTMSVLQIPTVF